MKFTLNDWFYYTKLSFGQLQYYKELVNPIFGFTSVTEITMEEFNLAMKQL